MENHHLLSCIECVSYDLNIIQTTSLDLDRGDLDLDLGQ